MQRIKIKNVTVSALLAEPNIDDILAAYGVESSINGLPVPSPATDFYKQLEADGRLHVIAAFNDDRLVGFLCLLVSFIPHYSRTIASTESFFVHHDYRGHGAGLALLWHARRKSNELGATGFFVSAPSGSRLADVMSKMKGYRETNRVFFAGDANE